MMDIKLLSDLYEHPLTKDEVRARLIELAQKDLRQLKKDIIEFNEKRAAIVEQMENNPDPLFRKYLEKYKKKLGRRAFNRHRLKVYALCNRRAMSHYLPLDRMVFVDHPEDSD